MAQKFCAKCRKHKDAETAFSPRNDGNGMKATCDVCMNRMKEYFQTQAGREAQHRANHSDSGKESQKKYNKTDKAKSRQDKFGKSAHGRIVKRQATHRNQNDPRSSLHRQIANEINHVLRDPQRKVSRVITTNTDFESVSAVRQFFHSLNHDGSKQIDHILAKCMYDCRIPQEVRKCWNRRNLRSVPIQENRDKTILLPDYDIIDSLRDLHPAWWNGHVPSDDQVWEYTRDRV